MTPFETQLAEILSLKTRLAEIVLLPEPAKTEESVKIYISVLHEGWEAQWQRRKQELWEQRNQ